MGYQIIIVMMLIKNTGERGSGRVGGDTNVRPLFLSVVSYSVHDY